MSLPLSGNIVHDALQLPAEPLPCQEGVGSRRRGEGEGVDGEGGVGSGEWGVWGSTAFSSVFYSLSDSSSASRSQVKKAVTDFKATPLPVCSAGSLLDSHL